MFSNSQLKKLIIPLIIEQTLSVTIGMTDIMMISVEGEAAVSGVSLVDMINMLLLLFREHLLTMRLPMAQARLLRGEI